MSPSDRTLSGRTVLVTGAARGIGAEVSQRLAARGAQVALVDLDAAAVETVAAECPGSVALVADVTDADALQAAVKEAVARFGGIDVVLANAGIASVGMVRSIDPAAFERTIEINLLGVWRTVRACLPYVIERRGYILPTASLAAAAHSPGMAAYAASKAGVEAFADCLRAEVAHLGVSVGCAYFSFIDTPMVRGADATAVGAAMKAELKGPLGRSYPVADAAEAVLRGIERRSRRVVAPGWVRGMLLARDVLQPLAERLGRASVPEADRIALAEV
ncbi:MAG: SDR family oxidoreductase, partial [Solirubrobacterales bacterium]|nr:SDR family oxidoreductase [Solirubrobacterales bacterium]